MSFFYSSGDLTLDKRYDYALGFLSEGDLEACADLLAQTLEKAPNWLPVLSLYGDCLAKLHNPKAETIYAKLASLDTQDIFGGSLKLARLKGQTREMQPAYIRELFESYAPKFETALRENLHYQGPEIVMHALQTCGFTQANAILDLGCGTGLMANFLHAPLFEGVDLSPAMLKIAAQKQKYSKLHAGDMLAFLQETQQTYDLVLAADVYVYVGDLAPHFKAVRSTLNGLLAFTVQSGAAGFTLGEDLRFAHSESYLRATLNANGFTLRLLEPCVTRQDAGKAVEGFVVVAS